jgi:putative ABC transport system permease protein
MLLSDPGSKEAPVRYLPLIWSGIWRRPARAVLILLQICSAFTLFGMLQGLDSGINQAIASTHGNRLYITNRVAVSDPLPIAMLERIRSIPAVRAVTPRGVLLGIRGSSDQPVPIIAVEVGPFFRIYNEIEVTPPGAVDALRNKRTGAIIGSELARRYGWKVGDRIDLQSSVVKRDGSRHWSFDVVGAYTSAASVGTPPPTLIITNFDYLNMARAYDAGGAAMFVALIDDARDAGAVSLAIDNAFGNSAHETRTLSEGDQVATQLRQTVDLDFIVHSIVAAVFFALLLATGLLMMQAVRERTPELAVLKALGFSEHRILAVILAESVTLCLIAAAIGLALAAVLLPQARALVGAAHVPLNVVAAGLGCALLLAVIAGAVPALRGARLQVVDALAAGR